MMVFVDFR